MSKYRDAVLAQRSSTPLVNCLTAEVRENYPEIAALLGGEKNPQGQWEPSPCSITLFIDDGRLKACVKAKHDNLIAYTTISASEGILEALEAIFCKADLEWKCPPKRK